MTKNNYITQANDNLKLNGSDAINYYL